MDLVRRDAVAIVDDDPAVLASLAFLLRASGYTVEAFGSAEAFLAGGQARAACLVVDQHMPGMTGLDLIAHLRAKMPVLLVSSALTPALRDRAAQLGAAALAKPLDEHDLLRFVAEHVKGSVS